MQPHRHLTPAARRFYSVFYSWAIFDPASAAPVPFHRACCRRHAGPRPFCSSTRARRETTTNASESGTADGRERRSRPRLPVTRPAASNSREAAPYRSNMPPKEGGNPNPELASSRWATDPVFSQADRPSASLDPWEKVIRFRDPQNIMLEVTMPEKRLDHFRTAYGPVLKFLQRRYHVRLKIGDVTERPRKGGGRGNVGTKMERLCAVMVWGEWSSVAQVSGVLSRYDANRFKDGMDTKEVQKVMREIVGVTVKERKAPAPFPSTESPQAQEAHLNVPDQLRSALRPLTHPVVLITTRGPNTSSDLDSLADCRGVTVSSFTALSLDPVPTITFNLKLPSRTWDALVASRHLCLHLLDATPPSAAIAHLFTTPHTDPAQPFTVLHKRLAASISPRASADDLAAPLITYRTAVRTHLPARLLPDLCVPVADHVIVVAEILDVLPVAGVADEVEGESDEVEGLSYSRRAYRAAGQAIELPELDTLGRHYEFYDEDEMADDMLWPPELREALGMKSKQVSGTDVGGEVEEEDDEFDNVFGFHFPGSKREVGAGAMKVIGDGGQGDEVKEGGEDKAERLEQEQKKAEREAKRAGRDGERRDFDAALLKGVNDVLGDTTSTARTTGAAGRPGRPFVRLLTKGPRMTARPDEAWKAKKAEDFGTERKPGKPRKGTNRDWRRGRH